MRWRGWIASAEVYRPGLIARAAPCRWRPRPPPDGIVGTNRGLFRAPILLKAIHRAFHTACAEPKRVLAGLSPVWTGQLLTRCRNQVSRSVLVEGNPSLYTVARPRWMVASPEPTTGTAQTKGEGRQPEATPFSLRTRLGTQGSATESWRGRAMRTLTPGGRSGWLGPSAR